MAQGVFGGMFSQRSAHHLPQSMVVDAHPHEEETVALDRTFEYALDALPVNAMFCDRDLILRFLNKESLKTLRQYKEFVPVPVDQIVGNSIHIFHKAPPNIERILGGHQHGGAHHLPHKATIPFANIKLDLDIAPMKNERGEYIGAVVVWGVSTQQALEKLQKSQQLQRNDIEHLNGNLQMVATATQEIQASIGEIAENAMKIATSAGQSKEAGEESKAAISKLRASSSGVAKVAELIASIATQTSVLALNANIEAARAGVHGKGFAVVASEVRKLAEQTANATAEIQAKVTMIGADIGVAMKAIDRISNQTEELSGLSQQMAAAAEEQHLATQEMAQNIERAAHRTSEIANMHVEDAM